MRETVPDTFSSSNLNGLHLFQRRPRSDECFERAFLYGCAVLIHQSSSPGDQAMSATAAALLGNLGYGMDRVAEVDRFEESPFAYSNKRRGCRPRTVAAETRHE